MRTQKFEIGRYPNGPQEAERAIKYFHSSGMAQDTLRFWKKQSPIAVDVGIQMVADLSSQRIQHQWAEILASRPELTRDKYLGTMSGGAFEGLALAFLQVTEDPRVSYVGFGEGYDELVSVASENRIRRWNEDLERVRIVEFRRSRYFKGTRIMFEGYPAVIPDGAMLARRSRGVIHGLVECNLRGFSKPIKGFKALASYLRGRPEIVSQFGAEYLGLKGARLDDQDGLMFVQAVRRDVDERFEAKAKRLGWSVVKTPFNGTDATQQTALILRDYLDELMRY